MSNQEQKQFNSENVSVLMTRAPGAKVKLDIQVSPVGADAAYQKALKNVNKEVNIPGFRKGKAPDSYIIQNYGKFIDQEWREILLETAFKEAMQLVQVYPYNDKSLERPNIRSISRDKGASISIEYEAYPEIPSIDTQSLVLKNVHPKAINDEDVDQVLHEIRLHHAAWEEISDRPVQEGDYIDLDIDAIEEGKNVCKDTRFEVKEGVMAPWLHRLVIGKNINDTMEGTSEKQKETPCETCVTEGSEEHHHHHHDHSHFIPTKCSITIKSIKNAILPELNDELAEKTGVKTIQELLPRIRQDLEQRENEHVKSILHTQLEDQLLDKFPFDIPSSLTKKEIKERVDYEISQLSPSLSEEEKKNRTSEIEQRVAQNINDAYRLAFLSNKIAKDHHIEVTSQEIVQEYMRQMMRSDRPIINAAMDPQEIQARLKDFLLRSKALDLMLGQAQKID